ncbi:MAG: DUF2911 domain-containing protein [Melioribacteraceae bacterium]|nr:DUF2911 domain-containing protein [Melioribacteraceae bacterium]
MKQITNLLMISLLTIFLFSSIVTGQDKEPKKSPKAKFVQTIGIDTEVTFEFNRPGVKGRTIWGELVPWGFEPGNKYSDEKPYPWRGGANENSTIEFSKDIMVEGQKVPAGKYSMHFKTGKDEWTVMLNKVNDQWGSYKYDPAQDIATFTVKPIEAPHQEWLTYGIDEYEGNTARAFLHWEKLKIPFKLEVIN